jgi:hypothetical protein
LIAIIQFAERCAKQGTLAQTRRKHKDEEELSKLSNALEAAFKRLQVRSSPIILSTLRGDHRQIESHIRTEKALNTLLTADNTLLTTSNTILATTDTILPIADTILTTANTILSTTSTIPTTSNTVHMATQILLTAAETGAFLPFFDDDV